MRPAHLTRACAGLAPGLLALALLSGCSSSSMCVRTTHSAWKLDVMHGRLAVASADAITARAS